MEFHFPNAKEEPEMALPLFLRYRGDLAQITPFILENPY